MSHTYTKAGAFNVTLSATESSGRVMTSSASITVTAPPPVISSVTKNSSSSFSLNINGSNFHPGCLVSINGTAVPVSQYKSAVKVVAKGGTALKAMVPKGVSVMVTVTNTDDGGVSAPFPYTR